MPRNALINEEQAYKTAELIADPVVRNLVKFAIAEARMGASRLVGQEEADWRAHLPMEPFDMQFFVHVMSSMFAKSDIVVAVLNGQDLARASGWDV